MPDGESRRYAELVGGIYEAALEPQRWTAVVQCLLPFVQAKSGMLFTPFDRIDAPGFHFPANISQRFLQEYAGRYQPDDPWARAARDAGLTHAGSIVLGDDVVPRAELVKSRFYREFLVPQDTGRICMSWIFAGDEHPKVLSTALTVHRSLRSRPFSRRSTERIRLLLPHLSHALGVMFRLRDAETKVAASQGALDRLTSGVVLVGERRQVVFANRAAARLLAERDGLMLATGSGSGEHIVAGTHAKSAEIDVALGTALAPASIEASHFAAGIRVPRSAGRAPVVLNVSTLPEDNAFGFGSAAARAIVFVTDPGATVYLDAEQLKRLYGLTAAETRLAEALCGGETLAEAAARLGVSENTIRSQLKQLFAKTGAHRQADLIKLLLALASSA